jgi:2-C-methyl-D-erythritol 4-phosphate cytidylyltransferase
MITADVIIVAAGSGTRFGSAKQLVLVGKPLYRHSVDTFASHPQIARIVLVVSEEVREVISSQLAVDHPDGRIELVGGGATRQGSVANGLSALSVGSSSEIVLVYDAARPGVEASLISSVIDASAEHGAALAAIPVVDTLKREAGGLSVATVSRASLWRAQTPQGAKRVLLEDAIREAGIRGYEATDEAELLERMGFNAKLVLGSERNMKVTYPEDLERVKKLLA